MGEETVEVNEDQGIAQEKVDDLHKKVEESTEDISGKDSPAWRAYREAKKKDRMAIEAAEKRAAEREAEVAALKAAMEAAFAKQAPVYPSYPVEEREETEDERIEKKVQAALMKREEAARRERQEREAREYPERLNQTYPDFNVVISHENLDYLEFHYPEISRPLRRLQDGYDKWSDIYHAVKKFVPNSSHAKKDAARAEANYAKPKSISAQSVAQSGEMAGGVRLSEERKAQNWERMQKLLRGVG